MMMMHDKQQQKEGNSKKMEGKDGIQVFFAILLYVFLKTYWPCVLTIRKIK